MPRRPLSAAASVALASMTKVAGTIAGYLSTDLPFAAASACEALNTAAAATSSKLVRLMKKTFGSSAVAVVNKN
jgi:peroxiredoxin